MWYVEWYGPKQGNFADMEWIRILRNFKSLGSAQEEANRCVGMGYKARIVDETGKVVAEYDAE